MSYLKIGREGSALGRNAPATRPTQRVRRGAGRSPMKRVEAGPPAAGPHGEPPACAPRSLRTALAVKHCGVSLQQACLTLGPSQQFRQLGDAGGDLPRLILCHEVGRSASSMPISACSPPRRPIRCRQSLRQNRSRHPGSVHARYRKKTSTMTTIPSSPGRNRFFMGLWVSLVTLAPRSTFLHAEPECRLLRRAQ
jgi:hypothetical protein